MPRPKKSSSSPSSSSEGNGGSSSNIATCGAFAFKTLVVVLLCTSMTFSLLYLRNNFNLDSFGMGESSMKLQQEGEQQQVVGGSSSSSSAGGGGGRVFESGKQIVERAFSQTYKHLVDQCASHAQFADITDEVSLMKCMKAMHNNHTAYPWWFETMLRDGSEHFLHSGWHIHILRSPTHMVQFCSMEKVASSEWGILKCRLDGKLSGRCHDTVKNLKPDEPHAVFIRDPLERFLSGFIDKCATQIMRDQEIHCEPNEVFAPEEGRDDRKAKRLGPPKLVEELAIHNSVFFDAYTDVIPLKWNVHFYPASLYCNGLYRTLPTYDFVGHMGEEFHDNLRAFGHRYNMEAAVAKVFNLKHANGTAEVNTPRNPRLKKNRTSTASKRIKEYYTPRTLKKVLQYLSIDYAEGGLGLPLPDWVDEILSQEAYSII